MSLTELDQLVRDRSSVLAWLKNASKVDSQSCTNYSLRLDVNSVLAMYCGQAYAGAKNYHDAPGELNKEIAAEIQRNRHTLVTAAAKSLVARYEERIRALKAEAEKVFAECECKGIEIEPGVYSGCDAAKTGATDCPERGGQS
jgi:hypothetical protein